MSVVSAYPIKPCLWFDGQAELAARFYVDVLGGALGSVSRYGEGAPFPAGTALMVEFNLRGQQFQALNGGPMYRLSPAMSLSITCANQAELDGIWLALLANGGRESRCGWLTDQFGLSWQVVPAGMGAILGGADKKGAARAMQAMMGMSKLDIHALQSAYEG
jgi:predicted 3-demethylubiquinone-9 3-methyltransferase (glyoxalase superfamily)